MSSITATKDYQKVLCPTKQRKTPKKIFGLDVETWGEKNHFYCAALYDTQTGEAKTFHDKYQLINEFLAHKKYQNSTIATTNLGFDFNAIFHKTEFAENFKIMFRGSMQLYAKSYMKFHKFHYKRPDSHCDYINFIDTLNYAELSVKELGKLISLPKLECSIIGRKPETEEEETELITYNKRDAEISAKGIIFLFDSFYKLGATCKSTIAATSMSLFRNKYLKEPYFQHDEETMLEQFEGYYGGRTEAFSRGLFKNYNYYDVNSLYPSVMINEFPDPNHIRHNFKGQQRYVEEFEGMSLCSLFTEKMQYPLLPYRVDKKLLFPCGRFKGWYNHVELRKALELGYRLEKIDKTYFYKRTCEPFKEFILDMYAKRNKYREEGSRMEYVVKILMNSLYGKFGQKFINRDNIIPFSKLDVMAIANFNHFERLGDYARISYDAKPPAFCFPEWASYVTSYARLKLYDMISSSKPIYCDTDSVITKHEFSAAPQLGAMKLERFIKEGIIIKPKMYMISGEVPIIKIKGIGVRLSEENFMQVIENPIVSFRKFVKFRESLRRKLSPNEIIDVEKALNLEDDKRLWPSKFDPHILQESEPCTLA